MTTYKTRYGPIYYDRSGNDHRPNLRSSFPKYQRRHTYTKLQKPAWRAFREAEKLVGRRLGKGPWSKRRARAIPITGSWRSFANQLSLWLSDKKRFADPYVSGHVEGIAVDLNTEWEHFELARECMRAIGWKQVRADEPWHWTWGYEV